MSKYDNLWIARLAIPGVTALIGFLSYSSQLLFRGIEPGSLSHGQYLKFNILVICIWISYAHACLTDPGRVSSGWVPDSKHDVDHEDHRRHQGRFRFCRKCEAIKPQRSHHCKICQRCIPKMDHHCPWTSNCVSHFTYPHFMRFLFYAVASMVYLEYFLYVRGAKLWEDRHMPSYLGPSVYQLVHLLVLVIVNTMTLLLLSIMLARGFYSLTTNVTTIEGWEIERHHQLLRRTRVLGGYLDGPDGIKVRIDRHEYPYDIGIWQNICAGMGTSNFLGWFWPLARGPHTDGLTFETNGFEEPGQSWPPPDPDRMPRMPRSNEAEVAFTHEHQDLSPEEEMQAFRARQQADLSRRDLRNGVLRRKPFGDRFDRETNDSIDDDYLEADADEVSGEEGWQDSDGNRLRDFGVEEDLEFYDEDDIPIAKLLQRRRQQDPMS